MLGDAEVATPESQDATGHVALRCITPIDHDYVTADWALDLLLEDADVLERDFCDIAALQPAEAAKLASMQGVLSVSPCVDPDLVHSIPQPTVPQPAAVEAAEPTSAATPAAPTASLLPLFSETSRLESALPARGQRKQCKRPATPLTHQYSPPKTALKTQQDQLRRCIQRASRTRSRGQVALQLLSDCE